VTAHYLSFDVEDWFHTQNLAPAVARADWDSYELRVDTNTRRLLDLLDDHDTRATFFVLGHVADRAPELVREIARRGHEVASHGYDHRLLHRQNRAEIRRDLRRSKDRLEQLTGEPVRGYRAPTFSITTTATEELADLGYEYDSSYFPFDSHDRYGSIEVAGDDTVTTTATGLTEIQLPVAKVAGFDVPIAGGGYFRFLPYSLFKRGVERAGRRRDVVFYLHPWELDPEQPRVTSVPLTNRIRHYTNLDRTYDRLDRLLSDFEWTAIGDAV
jgi:polysaccharide deacetylase family protein (PEP-CTERM system associated)